MWWKMASKKMNHAGSDRINQVFERANRPVFYIGKFPEVGLTALEP